MSKESYGVLKSRRNDYYNMLLLIRQRLVESGQASWRTETELKSLSWKGAEFSPEELGWVLSPEEQREWERLSKASNALAVLYRKTANGGKLTPEEEKQLKMNRDLHNQKAAMRLDVLKRLATAPQATPEQIERWRSMLVNQRVYGSARRAAAKITNKKDKEEVAVRKAKYEADMRRIKQLAALGGRATEDDRQELAALRKNRVHPRPQRQRLDSIKAKLDNGSPLTPRNRKSGIKSPQPTRGMRRPVERGGNEKRQEPLMLTTGPRSID